MSVCYENCKELLSTTSNIKSEFLNTVIGDYKMLIKRNVVSRLEKRKMFANSIETIIAENTQRNCTTVII